MNIYEIYKEHGDEEFLKFERVEHKRSQRPDLHAFLLLDALAPSTFDIVSAAEHDEIFLEVSPDKLGEVATEEQVVELIRCGVRLDTRIDSLAMFV